MHIAEWDDARVVTAPGIYSGISNDRYHSDAVTPEKALSSSSAKDLLDTCPREFWHNHVNPNRPAREPAGHFDIGTAAHLMFLEPDLFDDSVVAVHADDWRSKAAREARDAARADGKIPLLADKVSEIRAMRLALQQNTIARNAFRGGYAELSAFAQDDEHGIWCKCRPDYLPHNLGYIVDYKTSTTADPAQFGKKAADCHYHVSAAWYMDIVNKLTGANIRDFWFVVQSKTAPYTVSVCKLDDAAIEAGRILARKAVDVYAECKQKNYWPGYLNDGREAAFVVSLPPWAIRRALEA